VSQLYQHCNTTVQLWYTCPASRPPAAPISPRPQRLTAELANGMDIAYSLSTARFLADAIKAPNYIFLRRPTMTWSKPEFIDWRFGFEITLYIANR
jgi:pyrroloquinoline quinone biosynthesis protein A